MVTLKVMSFNLRNDYSPDGINVFPNRKPYILEMIGKEKPDIIGTQEVTDNMRAFLRDELPDYEVFGCAREKDYHGEHNAVCLRKEQFEVIEMKNAFLSFLVNEPGHTFGADQSSCSRMYTYLRLKHREAAPFQLVNTHLDHVGNRAKQYGMLQILQHLNQKDEKWILTGDMNAFPDEDPIRLVTSMPGRAAVDCTAGLGGTFHGFGRAPAHELGKIDYIFTDAECDPERSYVVPDEHKDGIYYSDHYAVCAFITIP